MIKIDNLKDTKKIASEFSKTLKGNEIICLIGDLGAGKTTFTKFLLEELGVLDNVTSPTFVLRSDYESLKGPVYHFDWYRMDSKEDLVNIDFFDVLGEGLVIIEWADKFLDILNGFNIIKINFMIKNGVRYINIER